MNILWIFLATTHLFCAQPGLVANEVCSVTQIHAAPVSSAFVEDERTPGIAGETILHSSDTATWYLMDSIPGENRLAPGGRQYYHVTIPMKERDPGVHIFMQRPEYHLRSNLFAQAPEGLEFPNIPPVICATYKNVQGEISDFIRVFSWLTPAQSGYFARARVEQTPQIGSQMIFDQYTTSPILSGALPFKIIGNVVTLSSIRFDYTEEDILEKYPVETVDFPVLPLEEGNLRKLKIKTSSACPFSIKNPRQKFCWYVDNRRLRKATKRVK